MALVFRLEFVNNFKTKKCNNTIQKNNNSIK
ncbi:Hypothetical Protein SLY_0894 [Strawberry lethal yellows phytoplasma (CPA) str. NZSb11]|uniref:Uncharacterized protein n=1 Tax=Strawberry lethal yellows phytoplasma (CPA) str. NZSb11 TaxID=980422 RepID=R4S1W0_PHYAS|nr:Hypothetical Protein SLY_0894 [Strawberry lethal yellows phytoplasma (CPA) str. NZSb11]